MYKSINIETPRLVIRRLEEKDFSAFYDLMKDPIACRYLPSDPSSKTDKAIRDLFDKTIRGYLTSRQVHYYAIAFRVNDDFMGCIGIFETSSLQDMEIQFNILPGYWNHGFASEAAYALIQHAFEKMQVTRVFVKLHALNQWAIRVAGNLGMKKIKEESLPQGKFIHYSINKPE